MAKSMKNVIRESAKIAEQREQQVRVALSEGCFTRSKICKATGLTTNELSNLLSNNKELHAEYTIKKRLMADIAADNIFDIIQDAEHPQHFQASKYIIQNYKSDIDETLIPQMGDMQIQLGQSDSSEGTPVVINFTGGNKD